MKFWKLIPMVTLFFVGCFGQNGYYSPNLGAMNRNATIAVIPLEDAVDYKKSNSLFSSSESDEENMLQEIKVFNESYMHMLPKYYSDYVWILSKDSSSNSEVLSEIGQYDLKSVDEGTILKISSVKPFNDTYQYVLTFNKLGFHASSTNDPSGKRKFERYADVDVQLWDTSTGELMYYNRITGPTSGMMPNRTLMINVINKSISYMDNVFLKK